MENVVLWTVGILATLALGAKLVMWWAIRFKLPQADLVVLTYNSAQHIEGVIRSYLHMARMEGRDLRFYVIDGGSEDDTLLIIHKFKQHGLQIEVLTEEELAGAVKSAVDTCYHYIPYRLKQQSLALSPFVKENAPEQTDDSQDLPWGREIRMVDMRRRPDVCEYKTSS